MMPKTGTWLRVRREYNGAIAAADAHAGLIFDVARGTPRQGVLRAALEEQRKKRADDLASQTSRATPCVTP
jgi:hypothetical protein